MPGYICKRFKKNKRSKEEEEKEERFMCACVYVERKEVGKKGFGLFFFACPAPSVPLGGGDTWVTFDV